MWETWANHVVEAKRISTTIEKVINLIPASIISIFAIVFFLLHDFEQAIRESSQNFANFPMYNFVLS